MQLINKKNKIEIIGIILIIVLSLSLYFLNKSNSNLLEKKGVYIIGKMISASSGGETSWVYNFKYVFNKKTYFKNYNGYLSSEMKNDSLMFFQILPENPSICRQLLDIRVPGCIRLHSVPENG